MTTLMMVAKEIAKEVAIEVAMEVAMFGLLVFVLVSVSEELLDPGLEIIFVSFLVFLLLPDQPRIISDEIF